MTPDARERPAVSVVLPFLGSRAEAGEAMRSLAAIEGRADDEIIVVDNSVEGVALSLDGVDGIRVVAATVKRSAYAARNEGAELARSEWVLFLDADCRPGETILDDYFAKPVDADCGALAGEIVGAPGQRSLAARWARSRRLLSSTVNRRFSHRPMAPTANLLVRSDALAEVGGFPEGMTAAAGDIYLCWRLQEEGWRLCFRPAAIVEHRHRESVAALLAQSARDAAGLAWLNRVYPGTLPPPSVPGGLARSLAGAIVFALSGQLERARLKLLDSLVVIAQALGYRLGHRASDQSIRPPATRIVVVTEFPRRGDESVASLREAAPAGAVSVEAVKRARQPDWRSARGLEVRFWEDEGTLQSVRDAAWLVFRHPVRVIADRCRPADGADGRLPLRRLAPAARRVEAASGARLVADEAPSAVALCRRLARLGGGSQATGVR
jgi:hypothetical protein